MNDSIRTLLHYVIEGDVQKARAVAKLVLQSNKTQKDKAYCETLLKKMEAQEAQKAEIPYNLRGILQTSCTAYEFTTERYYISERERSCLEHIKSMYAAGGRLAERGIHYANAVLLHGHSGTGKTTFAQLVARELGLPFFYVSMTQLMNSYMGKTAQNMELVVNFISTLPCVCVLDEIDSIGTRRGDDTGVSGELKRVLLCVMQSLDRLPNTVILIAATNRPDAIDEALKRRFPLQHEVSPLSVEESKNLIKQYMLSVGLETVGSLDTFLSVDVSKRQSGLPFDNQYTAAAITDSLNERIAQAFNKNPKCDTPAVSLYAGAKPADAPRHPTPGIVENSSRSMQNLLADTPIGIPEKYKADAHGFRNVSPIERQLRIYDIVDYECPCCGKKRLRIARYNGVQDDFPEYGITCDECDWSWPLPNMSDYGEVLCEFRTWYTAWIYLGKPKDRVNEDLTREFL